MLCTLIRQSGRFITTTVAALITLFLLSSPVQAAEITLNLKEADIRALISTVSRFTGKNFVIDPRVKAKVTIVSAKTMSESEVYEVFLSILQVHGYAAVPVGNIIKIVPQVNAKQGPLPVVRGGNIGGDAFITRVITLNHVPASQLVPILRPLVPQQGHLAAYNPTNTLIITDHAANIKRLSKIIQSIDRPESDELEIIPLKHASAQELVRILNSLNTSSGGAKSAQAKKVTLAADKRTNSILMSGERATRLKIRATIAHLDTPLEDGDGNTQVIYMKYAKATDIAKILNGINRKSAQKGRKVAASAAASNINTGTNIQADEATNAIIITAEPNVIRRMKSIIRQLDIRRAQVLIESIIAEISNNKAKERSAQFVLAGKKGTDQGAVPIGTTNFGGAGGIIGLFGGNPVSAIGDGITIGVGSDDGTRFAFLLKALNADAATNILSTPSIVTLDNQEAEIVVGQNVPFITGAFSNTGAASSSVNPFQTIERQDVGITLKVTPQINDGDTIKLDINQEISNIAASSSASDIITNKRTLKTSVLVEDGEILVLGGLIDDTMRDTVQKVPLLGDLPLLGWLFRSHTTTKEKQNLMIFMRPQILRDKNDSRYFTHEKYNYLRAQQIEAGEQGFGLLKNETTPLLPGLENLSPTTAKPSSELDITEEAQIPSTAKQNADHDPWDGDDDYDF
jgi:general secretion pathway protein D